MRTQTLVLPYLAPNLNDLLRSAKEAAAARGVVRYQRKVLRKRGRGMGVRDAYKQLKAQWATRVLAHVREQSVEPFPAGAHLAFEIVEPNRRRDPDNIATGCAKFVLDGLVKCGVLPDDGWDGVLSLRFAWETGQKPCVRVTLSEAV